MSEPIVLVDEIVRSAQQARSLDDCPYPHFSDARARWMKEYRAKFVGTFAAVVAIRQGVEV